MISICIPTYEQPQNLINCLNSIKMQTYANYEVIISDDSRTEDVKSVVKTYESSMNIKYYSNDISLGSPENWNNAIKHAVGDYIKIMHHDDSFANRDSLQKIMNIFNDNEQIDIVFCSSRHVDNNQKYISSHILNPRKLENIRHNPKILLYGNHIGAPSIAMYRKKIDILFDRRLKWLVDIDFYISVLSKYKFAYTTEGLVNINIGEENRVTNECIANRSINIYETLILYSKLNFSSYDIGIKYYLAKLFARYNINTLADIRACGYNENLDDNILFVLRYSKYTNSIFLMLSKIKSSLKQW